MNCTKVRSPLAAPAFLAKVRVSAGRAGGAQRGGGHSTGMRVWGVGGTAVWDREHVKGCLGGGLHADRPCWKYLSPQSRWANSRGSMATWQTCSKQQKKWGGKGLVSSNAKPVDESQCVR